MNKVKKTATKKSAAKKKVVKTVVSKKESCAIMPYKNMVTEPDFQRIDNVEKELLRRHYTMLTRSSDVSARAEALLADYYDDLLSELKAKLHEYHTVQLGLLNDVRNLETLLRNTGV